MIILDTTDIVYKDNYNLFSVVRADIGLGIGVDIGQTCLALINGDFTVVGSPVVYACRLSSAPANHTLLNQNAFEKISERYSPHFNYDILKIPFKNQGIMITYDARLNIDAVTPEKPDWEIEE